MCRHCKGKAKQLGGNRCLDFTTCSGCGLSPRLQAFCHLCCHWKGEGKLIEGDYRSFQNDSTRWSGCGSSSRLSSAASFVPYVATARERQNSQSEIINSLKMILQEGAGAEFIADDPQQQALCHLLLLQRRGRNKLINSLKMILQEGAGAEI